MVLPRIRLANQLAEFTFQSTNIKAPQQSSSWTPSKSLRQFCCFDSCTWYLPILLLLLLLLLFSEIFFVLILALCYLPIYYYYNYYFILFYFFQFTKLDAKSTTSSISSEAYLPPDYAGQFVKDVFFSLFLVPGLCGY
jgi:hypothetical protein